MFLKTKARHSTPCGHGHSSHVQKSVSSPHLILRNPCDSELMVKRQVAVCEAWDLTMWMLFSWLSAPWPFPSPLPASKITARAPSLRLCGEGHELIASHFIPVEKVTFVSHYCSDRKQANQSMWNSGGFLIWNWHWYRDFSWRVTVRMCLCLHIVCSIC